MTRGEMGNQADPEVENDSTSDASNDARYLTPSIRRAQGVCPCCEDPEWNQDTPCPTCGYIDMEGQHTKTGNDHGE